MKCYITEVEDKGLKMVITINIDKTVLAEQGGRVMQDGVDLLTCGFCDITISYPKRRLSCILECEISNKAEA